MALPSDPDRHRRPQVGIPQYTDSGRPVNGLSNQAQGPVVAVHVGDTGIGVDPSLLKTANGEPGHEPIFDELRRGANVIAAGIPGTGLGPSIVREAVERARRRIWAEPIPSPRSGERAWDRF